MYVIFLIHELSLSLSIYMKKFISPYGRFCFPPKFNERKKKKKTPPPLSSRWPGPIGFS